MFTPFVFVALSELLDLALDLRKSLDPLGEHASARLRDHVDPLGGTGSVVVPGRVDEAVALERAQDPVEVAHVDPLGRHERLELLQQLVAVTGAIAQDEEDGGLREALQPRPDLPAPRAETTASPGVARKPHPTLHATPPSKLQCKTHIARP